MQKESVDVWKQNISENLKAEVLEYETTGEFLADLRKKFERDNKEVMEVAELKKLKQGKKTIKEFVQKFRRAVRESRYKEWSLIEEFKK